MHELRMFRFVRSGPQKRRRDEYLRGLALEQLCHAIPTGAAALDAHGNVLFCNRQGSELLSRWIAAPSDTVPAEILAACERLRAGEHRPGQRGTRPNFGGRILVRHARQPSLTAVVALERNPRDRRFAIFCVVFQDALTDSVRAGRKDQLALLTIAERRVAKLVAEGLRNRDIAAVLGKSITTVKSQLGTIFSKLSVESRTQLVAILRPTDSR
jgi:DNA-binding CsgD family transcriptional regulator